MSFLWRIRTAKQRNATKPLNKLSNILRQSCGCGAEADAPFRRLHPSVSIEQSLRIAAEKRMVVAPAAVHVPAAPAKPTGYSVKINYDGAGEMRSRDLIPKGN